MGEVAVDKRRVSFALYRVLAYITGVFLLGLTFLAMPAKYLVGETSMFALVGAPQGWEHWFGPESPLMHYVVMPHGYIYMAYVLVVLWVSLDRRWGAGRTLGVVLAGTVPILGFVVEHRVVKAEKAKELEAERQATQAQEPAPTG
jgi:integral membrane protein